MQWGNYSAEWRKVLNKETRKPGNQENPQQPIPGLPAFLICTHLNQIELPTRFCAKRLNSYAMGNTFIALTLRKTSLGPSGRRRESEKTVG
jgi:hypothetical protein